MRPRQPLADKFWRRVTPLGDLPCWEWEGPRSGPNGYGLVKEGGKNLYAHRASWILCRGPTPDGMHVLHHCDNKPCVNPNRLYIGTLMDNSRDAKERGRTPTGERNGMNTCPWIRPYGDKNWARRHPELIPRGEASRNAKLRNDDIRAIRYMHETGAMSMRRMASAFGVSESQVKRIAYRKSWSHLSDWPITT